MKKTVLIILNTLLILPFLFFFRRGAYVAVCMLPVWLVMTVANTICAKDIKQLLLYNGWLALFAAIGIFACGQLYFKYVYWDGMGEVVMGFEMAVAVIYFAALTGIEALIQYRTRWKKK